MAPIRKHRRRNLPRPVLPYTPSTHEMEDRKIHERTEEQANIQVHEENRNSRVCSEEQGRIHEDGNRTNRESPDVIAGIEAFSDFANKIAGGAEPVDAMASPITHVESEAPQCTIHTTRMELPSRMERVLLQMERPSVELQRAGLDQDHERPVSVPELMISQQNTVHDQEELSKVSGGCKLVGEVPSTKSGRERRDFVHDFLEKGKRRTLVRSKIMSNLLVDKVMTRTKLMKNILGSAAASKYHPQAEAGEIQSTDIIPEATVKEIPNFETKPKVKTKVQAENLNFKAVVASPPSVKRRHFLRSSSNNNELHNLLEEDHPLRKPEGSLLHSLYLQVLAYDREGISMEELLVSFQSQTLKAMFADDWEEQVKHHLKHNSYFDRVRGRYLLSEFLVHPSSKRSAKGKEKELSSASGYNQGFGEEKSKGKEKELSSSSGYFLGFGEEKSSKGKEKELSSSSGYFLGFGEEKSKGKEKELSFASGYDQGFDEEESKEKELSSASGYDQGFDEEESKEKELSSASDYDQGFGEEKSMQPTRGTGKEKIVEALQTLSRHAPHHRLSKTCKTEHKGPGSLRAKQATIIAEIGVQEGARRCSKTSKSFIQKKYETWQCPLMAMEGRKICEHHRKQQVQYARNKILKLSQHQESDLVPGTGSKPESQPLKFLTSRMRTSKKKKDSIIPLKRS